MRKQHKLNLFIFLTCFVFVSVVLLSQVSVVQALSNEKAPVVQGSSDESARVEAERLFDEGMKLYEQRTAASLRQAIETWKKALKLYQNIGDKKSQAKTLNNIGAVYDSLGNKQQALKFYNQSLPLTIEVGDKSGQARTLNLCRLQRLQRLQIKPLTLLSFSTTYRVVT